MRLSLLFCLLLSSQLWSQDQPVESSAVGETDSTNQLMRRTDMIDAYPDRILPIESYFRDRIFTTTANFTPTFPVMNRKVSYLQQAGDFQKRYSTFGYILYQRELITLSEDKNYLWITPLIDISLGKDLVADSLNRISQNTRGARIEGNFGNKVLFSTSFFENQAVLPSYAAQYASSKGEFYPNLADSSYYQQNAVISGAARTKPFKENGFDYAYAVGFVSVKLRPNMTLSGGNNSLFVGSGYRSMLWSDHSLGAMNLNFQWELSSRWTLQVVRMRGMNMLRRLGAVNGEAYYEPTSLSMSTLYFHINRNAAIGIFEGGVWDRGDSLRKTAVSPLYFLPLPGASSIEEATGGRSNTVLGLDGNYRTKYAMFYGQAAMNPFVAQSTLFQAGIRLFNSAKYRGSWLQFEYNQAGANSYTSNNPRMNYASYNLPLAHPAGTNFQEFLFRGNYEKDHWFVSTSFHYYPRQVEQSVLLPIYQTQTTSFKQVLLTVVEAGYRFNRAYGLECFAQFRYRKSTETTFDERSWVSAGIRTAIRNHYYDY